MREREAGKTERKTWREELGRHFSPQYDGDEEEEEDEEDL